MKYFIISIFFTVALMGCKTSEEMVVAENTVDLPPCTLPPEASKQVMQCINEFKNSGHRPDFIVESCSKGIRKLYCTTE